MAKERILIAVKTYPTLSKKYGETVCTAGIRNDGSWVRLYPVPFRRLEDAEQYGKYDWIELDLVRNKSDCRPESHRPRDPKAMPVVGHIGTNDQWHERRRLLLETCTVHHRIQPLLDGAKANSLSQDRPALLPWNDAAVSRFLAQSVGHYRRFSRATPHPDGLILMPHAYTEDHLVEQPAIGLFATLARHTAAALRWEALDHA